MDRLLGETISECKCQSQAKHYTVRVIVTNIIYIITKYLKFI